MSFNYLNVSYKDIMLGYAIQELIYSLFLL